MMNRIICSILVCPNADEEYEVSKSVATSRIVAEKWMSAELTRINETNEHYCFAYATEFEVDYYGDEMAITEGRLAIGDTEVEWWSR